MYQYTHNPKTNYYKPYTQKSNQNHTSYELRSAVKKNQIDHIRYNQRPLIIRDQNRNQSAFKNNQSSQSNTKSMRQSYTPLSDNFIHQSKSGVNQKNYGDRFNTKNISNQQITLFRNTNANSKQDQLLRKLQLYEQKYQVGDKNKIINSNFKFSNEKIVNDIKINDIYRKKSEGKFQYEYYEQDSNKNKIQQQNTYIRKQRNQNKYLNTNERQKPKSKQQIQYINETSYQNLKYTKQNDLRQYNYKNGQNSNGCQINKKYVQNLIKNERSDRKYDKQPIKIQENKDLDGIRKFRNDYSEKKLLRQQNTKHNQISKSNHKQVESSNFIQQRNKRKQQLKQRSQMLRLKMNSPSPLKKQNQLSAIKSQKNIQDPHNVSKLQKINIIQKTEDNQFANTAKHEKLQRNYDRYEKFNERPSNNLSQQERCQKQRKPDYYEQKIQKPVIIDRYDRSQKQYSYQRDKQVENNRFEDQKSENLKCEAKQSERKRTGMKTIKVADEQKVCKKLQFEEQTYRKIQTINQLNNKINERIKHILSNFNQQI